MKNADLFDTTNMLLDRFAEAENLTTDYAIAKALGCAPGTIRNYRRHKTKMDPTTAVQIAERLRMDPLMVIAKVNTERSKNRRVHAVWGKYSGRLLLAAVVALAPLGDRICAKTTDGAEHLIHYTHKICAWFGAAARLRWGCRRPLRAGEIA